MDDLVNYSFKDYVGADKDEKIREFIVDFCNHNDILNKRINKLFAMNPWIKSYYDKDDVKQEVILALLEKSLKRFPYIVGEDRLRYFNTVVSSVLCNLLEHKFEKAGTLVLNKKMEFDTELIEHEDNSINEIFDLFLEEHLERELLKLYYEGYTQKEMMTILNIGHTKFERIRNNIKSKLRKEGYVNED